MSAAALAPPPGRLVFSVAGVPRSARGTDSLAGVERVAELGLGGLEIEFVHGVRIQAAAAGKVRARAAELGVALTCHGPYYINLNAQEAEKRQASVKRVLDTARAAQLLGARSFTFHAAFYLGAEPAEVQRVVRDALVDIRRTLDEEQNPVQVRPELTGKPSQHGDLDELLQLAQEVPGVLPCIDWSHLHARTGGRFNDAAAWDGALDRVVKALGREALQDMYMHVSGIDYTPKGERKHLEFKDADLRYKELLGVLKRRGVQGVLVCESPTQEDDTLILQEAYRRA
ncbi:MAG TPA: TIM barrel protein [Myxococcota bacterium]|nr:TIM barrel protein [Myxococcota bacterium]HRY96966.1 TIM barrel protein [Myxococcota bacterium]HSA22400.1 TIM barrel protein [Myxococcota bacterium]